MKLTGRSPALVFCILSLSFIFLSGASSSADSPRERIRPPVFFSYAWPIGPETVRDFTAIDMDVISVIDIGPDSLSYPPSIRKSYPPEVFERWHGKGKFLVRRCYDRPFGDNNKKAETFTVDDIVSRWSHSLEEPGVDGIAIDEFIKKEPERIAIWVEALYTIRGKFPDKLIFCWIAGKGLEPADLHVALRDCADYIMPEIYYRESAAKGFPDFAFTRFNDAVTILEKNAPGISKKILMGVGVHDKLFNDDPAIDYGDFIEAQIRYISSDPLLKDLPGLAFYTPMSLTQEHIRLLDRLVKRYYPIK